MFNKVLIANRGEIALRINRACQEMGIKTVVVHSTADENAMYVRLADESVCIGPPAAKDSYLNMPAIISAATITNADAIHPGIGFLAENARFAEMVVEHDFVFIGPKAEHIAKMGHKTIAKKTMEELGVPTIPGSDGEIETAEEAQDLADDIGYPVLIKAAAGGGGKGMKVARTREEVTEAFSMAKNESKAAFGDDTVYMEKYLDHPRHIEIQVFGDNHGNAIHLGERDCSIQRKHQKVVEEGPSPALSPEERHRIGELSAKTVRDMGYSGAGTMEYLYQDGEFYFLEMNTRLQVEHPVTEMITGMDLVREQILVASGQPLSVTQEDVEITGHAIELRINAENPVTFMPSPGKIMRCHPPGGLNVRFDSAIYDGYVMPPYYDSLVAKLIVSGRTREGCLMRLKRALRECVIEGIDTIIPLHQKILAEPEFQSGDYNIHWLERKLGQFTDAES
jgi:acetyl-CoA carboxylase biotin carboxylase subunit